VPRSHEAVWSLKWTISARHKAELHHHLGGVGMGMEFGDLAILGTNEVGSVACDLAAGRCQLHATHA
jgi:hypothetical protein